MNKYILTLVIFICSYYNKSTEANIHISELDISKKVEPTKELITKLKQDSLFNKSIEFLQQEEGFRSKVYIDNDGSRTIGYGHHILKNENYHNINKKTATEILIKDVNIRFKRIQKKYPNLKYNQQLALTLFVFNVGEGRLKQSTLNKLIRKNKSIDTEIIKWCHFKYKGKTITNRRLLGRRLYELNLYNI